MADKRIDEPTGVETVGHEWDGIEELNNPLPRWWLWTFYATIVFALAYCIAYPAWPLVHKGTEGVLGWTSRGQLARETSIADQARTTVREQLAQTPLERLPQDGPLMRQAIAGGAAAFKVNCLQCHGSGAAGSRGYPNLNDDDWLWGGDIKAIETTIRHGIRQHGDGETLTSLMPAFGRDGMLTPDQIGDIAHFVRSLSGKEKPSGASQRGAQSYADNCAVCHGAKGEGSRAFGAPSLNDAIWLYGGTHEDVVQQISTPRHGVMPAWTNRLDPVTIKMLAAYVHSLGGGEDFVEVAAEGEGDPPAKQPDE